MAELCGVFCEYLWENWRRYNGTALLFKSPSIILNTFHNLWYSTMFLQNGKTQVLESSGCLNVVGVND